MDITNKEYGVLLQYFKSEYLNKIPVYKLLNNNFKYELSSSNRIIKIMSIMSNIEIDKTRIICTVLKINRSDKVLNYAYLYGNIQNNNIYNIYILNSQSLLSKDGEYRHRLIKYSMIDNLKKNKYYNYFYEYLNKEYKNKEYDLSYEIFNLYDTQILDNYKKKLDNSNILLNIYLISWLTEIMSIFNNDQEININESINNILFSNKDIIKFTNNYNKNKHAILKIFNILTYINDPLKIELGQKIIPFNYIQLKDYKNIIHHQWKELLINKIVLNLLFNLNSPCFAIFANWFLITNSNKNLFDNQMIFNKLFYSEKIKDILNYFYLVKNNLIEIDKNQNNNIITQLLSSLKKLITTSEENLLMSNVSIGYISEYTGKTIYDYFNKIIDQKNIISDIGNLYSDHEIFKKYIFEIIYSLYCLNLKGVIHGDLHLNNVTLNIQENMEMQDDNSKIFVLYNIDKDNHDNLNSSYIFKHLGTYPCIIDFSRSYIYLKYIDEDIIEKQKNKIRNKFIIHERKRIINELNKIFPNYIKNHYHKIKFLLKNTNFEILYKYFSAYDIFTFSTNLLIFLKKINIHKDIKLNEKNIELLNNISKRAYFFLEQIIIQENYDSSVNHDYPNYLIMTEFFKENLIKTSGERKNKIIDIFSINDIDKFKNIKQMQFYISELLNKNINKDNTATNELKNKIKTITKILERDTHNEKLDIEKIINNEYYTIKSNLLLANENISSSLVDTTGTLSLDII